MCMHAMHALKHVPQHMHGIQRQLCGLASLLKYLFGFQGLNSDFQARPASIFTHWSISLTQMSQFWCPRTKDILRAVAGGPSLLPCFLPSQLGLDVKHFAMKLTIFFSCVCSYVCVSMMCMCMCKGTCLCMHVGARSQCRVSYSVVVNLFWGD